MSSAANKAWAMVLLHALACGAKGILVKFLPNPPADSVARYAIYRSAVEGDTGVRIGELAPGPDEDTLRFPDPSAARGAAYYYSVAALARGGAAGPASSQTRVALPRLALPDTLASAPGQAYAQYSLAAAADPLRGKDTLRVEVLEPARFAADYDPVSGRLRLSAKSGKPDSGRAVIRAAYFGKFADLDTAWVRIAAAAPAGLAAPALSFARAPRTAHSLRGQPLRLRAGYLDSLVAPRGQVASWSFASPSGLQAQSTPAGDYLLRPSGWTGSAKVQAQARGYGNNTVTSAFDWKVDEVHLGDDSAFRDASLEPAKDGRSLAVRWRSAVPGRIALVCAPDSGAGRADTLAAECRAGASSARIRDLSPDRAYRVEAWVGLGTDAPLQVYANTVAMAADKSIFLYPTKFLPAQGALKIAHLPASGYLYILNPLGEVVYHTHFRGPKDPYEWDGRGDRGGMAMPSLYHVHVQDEHKEKVYDGSFLLIR